MKNGGDEEEEEDRGKSIECGESDLNVITSSPEK